MIVVLILVYPTSMFIQSFTSRGEWAAASHRQVMISSPSYYQSVVYVWDSIHIIVHTTTLQLNCSKKYKTHKNIPKTHVFTYLYVVVLNKIKKGMRKMDKELKFPKDQVINVIQDCLHSRRP
jgi:hypothetical protein